ncbi:FtsH protease activity modulator HflK [Emcibacter sp. SYSU 3D8]|uniref:FtsH protease activity modulator HflK n=1 Tax=Emcibacter sp. SYSU 3D8 TaxID=3133969 RepID=UPI0031FECAB9
MPWQNNSGGGNGGRGPWGQGPRPTGPTPPNLDELLRRGQDRMKTLFPGGGGSFGGARGIAIGLGLLFVFWIFSGSYLIKPGQQGTVLIFGAWDGVPKGEGWHWAPPAPIGKVIKLRVQEVRRLEIGFASSPAVRGAVTETNRLTESLMLTGDENIIDVDFEVFWRIDNAGKYLFNIQDQEDTVKGVAESAMREVIGQRPLESALTKGRLEVEQETQELMQQTLTSYDAGVLITDVKLRKADTPAEVIDDFRDVQAAGADREAKINEAQKYRAEVIPAARGQAAQIVQQAEAYKAEVVARSQGEAARFTSVYDEYRQSSDVTKKRMYIETMEQVLRNVNKVIIDNKGGVVPYLPLPEVQKRQTPTTGTPQ